MWLSFSSVSIEQTGPLHRFFFENFKKYSTIWCKAFGRPIASSLGIICDWDSWTGWQRPSRCTVQCGLHHWLLLLGGQSQHEPSITISGSGNTLSCGSRSVQQSVTESCQSYSESHRGRRTESLSSSQERGRERIEPLCFVFKLSTPWNNKQWTVSDSCNSHGMK